VIALIDADIVVYQSSAAAETAIDWGDEEDIINTHGSKSQTREGIERLIGTVMEATECDSSLLVFSDTANFRKKVYPKYKSNRAKNRKPITYWYGRRYVEENYQTMFRPTLEADDCLGILATGDVAGFRSEKVVCSIDKDMRSFPCRYFDWKKPELGIQEICEAEADLNFYTQTLTGDTTDGYPGCPGVGPVGAAKLLDACQRETVWATILAAYNKKKISESDALVQARCARILRAEDYDFDNQTPILWVPEKGEA
jgi:DNA polymerase-1